MTPTQIQLFRQAQSGDRHARNRLFEAHQAIIAAVIIRHFMSHEWGECWQAGTFGLIGAIEGYKPGRDFAPYAWGAIYYKILDDVRRQPPPMVSLNTPNEEGQELINDLPDDAPSLDEILIGRETAEQRAKAVVILRELITHLSERDQLILALRYGFDAEPLELQPIGDRLGTSAQSIHASLVKMYGYLSRSPALRDALGYAPVAKPWVPGAKWCNACQTNLPLESFRIQNKATGQRKSPCNECRRKRDNERRLSN